MDYIALWNAVVASLREKLSNHTFRIWIAPLRPAGISGNSFQLAARDQFHQLWINDHYLRTITDEVRRISSQDLAVTITVSKEQPADAAEEKPALPPEPPLEGRAGQFVERYTFENFVAGPSNQFAHATAFAIATEPGKNLNPLLIYGRSGLGKTHLLNAIGTRVRKQRPFTRVVLVSCEQFVRDYVNALADRGMEDFRRKYRSKCDVLLIDDVHFLARKESSQDEFFHTFNELYSANRQMVFASDRHPKEIKELQERLVTRFMWGITADIQVPDYETRRAILQKKALIHNVKLPEEVGRLIAGKVTSNVRELEGCLLKLEAFSSFGKEEITLEMARRVLRDVVAEPERTLSVEDILEAVSGFFQAKATDLKSESRRKEFVEPRQIVMYLSRKLTKQTFQQIGSKLGGKDYSTVISAHRKVEQRIKQDSSFKSLVESIESLISS